MSDASDELPAIGAPEQRPLGRWERWTTDWNGEPIIEWDTAAHAAWCEKWAPRCPDGNPQRLRQAIGFRERNTCELELRVPLERGEHGACRVIIDEQGHEVHVRVLVCYDDNEDDQPLRSREFTDCPVRVWLERPLRDRAVIDVDSDEELDLYTPEIVGYTPQPDARA